MGVMQLKKKTEAASAQLNKNWFFQNELVKE
jgi:hypothetical protein